MGVPAFLPWQHDIAHKWLAERNRFAHAWLIHGLAGIGKRQFALAAAAALLCESPVNEFACGKCSACQWVAAASHPDLRLIRSDAIAAQEGDEPEEAGGTKKALSRDIRIDQLRQLHTWFNTATHRGGFRVAVLYPAEALNIVSANAILKVLEEPSPRTAFLLVSDTPDRLLPTLVSRCRRLPLPIPSSEQAQLWLEQQGLAASAQWLAAAGGAPLKALALSTEHETACPAWLTNLVKGLAQGRGADSTTVADAMEKLSPVVWVDTLQRWWFDMVLLAQGLPPRYYPELAPFSAELVSRVSSVNLAEVSRWLVEQKGVATHPLSAKLFVQTALQRIVLACQPTG